MSLSGNQAEQIQIALLDAFDEAALRQLVRYELNADLDIIAGGTDLEERTFNLVQWADQHGNVLAVVEGALRRNPDNPDLQALAEEAKSWHLEPPEQGKEPYQGLRFFDVGDKDRFFGREQLTAELVDYLRIDCLLTVIGASGSGKSSVVRAGVVPTLREDGRRLIAPIVTPTAHPLETLAMALVPRGSRLTAVTDLMDDMRRDARCLHLHIRRMLNEDGEHDRLLLVVDQFEELFTLCRDRTEQAVFVDNLLTAAAPDGVTTVILTLRADFYAHCAAFDNLRKALENHQRYIGAMREEELRTAIEQPAELGGWTLEPGLVDQMLDDVADEPGALPLLSHALLETWKRRSGRMLTFAGYRESGGVRGAIAHTADTVLSELSRVEQAIARSIFLRLTELGEGVQDTRRRVPLQELIPRTDAASTVEDVLQKLQDQRLVTTVREEQASADQGTDGTEPVIYVDVTHEALIREWPALKDWLAEDREGLRTHRKLTEEAQAWEKLNRDPGVLYRGLRLEQTVAWTEEHEDDVNEQERAFLAASQELAENERLEKERIERERQEYLQRELEHALVSRRRSWTLTVILLFSGWLGILLCDSTLAFSIARALGTFMGTVLQFVVELFSKLIENLQ